MKDNESILGSARARIEARKTGSEQITLVNELLFETKVKPLLEQIGTDLLERGLPPIYLPLIEEVRAYIEEEERTTLKLAQGVFYYHRIGDIEDSSSRKAHTLTEVDITNMDIDIYSILKQEGESSASKQGRIRKRWVEDLENGNLLEYLGVGVRTMLSGKGSGHSGHYGNITLGFAYFNNSFDHDISNRLQVQMVGEKTWSADVNSEEEINELIEKVVGALDSREFYSAQPRLFPINLSNKS